MTSVIEQVRAQSAGSTVTFTVATTPAVGDDVYVVVVSQRSTPRTISSVSGLGATWTALHTIDSSRVVVYRGTGATAAGTVTVTLSGTQTSGGGLAIVRGASTTTSASYTTTAAGSPVTAAGPSNTVGSGQAALVMALGSSNPITFPVSPAPASGWTSPTNGTLTGIAYATPAASATHQLSLTQSGGVADIYIAQVVVGDAVTVTTVTGGQAAETDTGQAGSTTVGAVVAGSQAAETDTGQAGSTTAGAVVSGGQAAETDAPQAGGVVTGQIVEGGQATESDSGEAGSTTVGAVVEGGQGPESDTGQAGTTIEDATVVGGQAAETDTAQGGAVVLPDPAEIDLSTFIEFNDSVTGWDGTYLTGDTVFYVTFPVVELDPATTYTVEVDYEHTGAESYGDISMAAIAGQTDAEVDASTWGLLATTPPITPSTSGTAEFTIGPGVLDWDASVVGAGEHYALFQVTHIKITAIRFSVAAVEPSPPLTTNTTNDAYKLTLGGWMSIEWEPAVEPRPLVLGAQALYAAAYGEPVMNGTMPSYDVSPAWKPKWRQRILIGGKDMTYDRGVTTPEVEYQLADPLLYGTATIQLPQISATREWGKPWLAHLRKSRRVKVQLVDDNDVVQATVYKGFVMGPRVDGAGLTLTAGGEAQGRAALRDRQVPVFKDVLDLKRILWRAISDLGLRFLPRLGEPGIGIRSLNFGGTGMLEHIEEGIARATKPDGTMRTVMPNDAGIYRLRDKDTTTVHWTVFLDEHVSVGSLNSDLAEEPNRVYATTIAPNGMRWNNAAVPGLVQGPAPDYPMNDGSSLSEGATDEDTDSGDGISVMINRLGATDLLDIRDTPGGFDEDVTDALARLQRRAGLTGPVGVMTPELWRALWDLDDTGMSRKWSSIQPAAEHPSVQRYIRSASGAVIGLNDEYDQDVVPVDLTVDMGSGLTGQQAVRFSETLMHDPATDDWYGTITLRGGAVLIGEVSTGATVTPELMADARLVKPTENVWVPNFNGGTLFHIAAIEVKADEVQFTVDTRARPARDVWERIRVRRETRHNPRERWLGTRQSTTAKDAVQGFISWGGVLDRNIELEAGWNLIEVVVGDYGTIALLKTLVQDVEGSGEDITTTGHEYAIAVFRDTPTVALLNDLVPAPLAENGDRAWRRRATRKALNKYDLLYAAGNFEEPCGYGEDIKADDAPLTGEHVDDAGYRFVGKDGCTNAVAVWVAAPTTLRKGRIMWPLLEGGV